MGWSKEFVDWDIGRMVKEEKSQNHHAACLMKSLYLEHCPEPTMKQPRMQETVPWQRNLSMECSQEETSGNQWHTIIQGELQWMGVISMRFTSTGTTQALVDIAETEASNAESSTIANVTKVEHYKDNNGDIQEPTNRGDTNNQHNFLPKSNNWRRPNITNVYLWSDT